MKDHTYADREFNCMLNLPPGEYYDCVKTLNRNTKESLAFRMRNAPLDPRETAIVIAGSDGKQERHTQSRTELIIIRRLGQPGNLSSAVYSWYDGKYGWTKSHFEGFLATGLPELKTVGDESSPLAFAFGDRNLVYPDRTLNSQLVFGNSEILHDAKKQVLTESCADNETGKKIRDKMKKQLINALSALKTGSYDGQTIFTIDPPMQVYDENRENYSVGFKIAGLRPVQRLIDLITIRAIRKGQLDIDSAVMFPTDTVGRIEALIEHGVIPDNPALAEAYQWFIQQYHVAQDRYKRNGLGSRTQIQVAFDKKAFLTHRDTVLNFWESIKEK